MNETGNDGIHAQKKHYRRPRRRPAHLRTKAGCLTCRRRKKKCDETRIVCNNCSRGHLLCTWPSESPGGLRRRNSVDVVSDQGACPDVSSHSSTYPSSDLASLEHDGDGLSQSAPSANADCHRNDGWSSRMRLMSSAIPADSAPLFEFLRIAFLRSLVHPMTHEATVAFFSQEILKSAFSTPFLMDALLACCGAEFPADDVRYRRLAEIHYAKSVVGLRADLASDNPHAHSMVRLKTVIILCIYERSKPCISHGVNFHLLGEAQLIQLYLKRDEERILSESEKKMLRLILEAFIFHAATSIPFQQPLAQPAAVDSAFSLAERTLEEYFPTEICLYPSSPILGVPPKLFGYIREIMLMHQRSPVEGVDIMRCYDLEQTLGQWDQELTRRVLDSQNPHINQFPSSYLAKNSPKLYIIASRILLGCLITLASGTASTDANADAYMQTLASEGVRLITQLEPSTDYYAEYYCWPILVLGRSTVDEHEREILLSQVMTFWKETRNGTMKRLVDILMTSWDCEANTTHWL